MNEGAISSHKGTAGGPMAGLQLPKGFMTPGLAITPNHLPSAIGANECSTICSQGVAPVAETTPDANTTASHQDSSTSPLLPTITTHSCQRIGSTSLSSFVIAMLLAGLMMGTISQHSTAVRSITAADAWSYLLPQSQYQHSVSSKYRCYCLIASEHLFTHSQHLIAAIGTPATISQLHHRCQAMTAQTQ